MWRPAGGGYFAPGRGTFQGWKVPKDPRVVVLTKSAALRTPRRGHPSLRSLARPLPTTTTAQPLAALPPYGCGVPLAGTTLGRGWVPGGSAPYDFRTRGARLENGLNLFGAGMNLGPFRSPPAAARIYQIHVSPLFPLAPLVCLAFSAPLDLFCASRRGRCPQRPGGGYHPPLQILSPRPAALYTGRMGTSAPTGNAVCSMHHVGPDDPYPLWPTAISP